MELAVAAARDVRSENKLEASLCVFCQEQMKVLLVFIWRGPSRGVGGEEDEGGGGRDNWGKERTRRGDVLLLLPRAGRRMISFFLFKQKIASRENGKWKFKLNTEKNATFPPSIRRPGASFPPGRLFHGRWRASTSPRRPGRRPPAAFLIH